MNIICKKCHSERLPEEMKIDKRNKTGFAATCKDCNNKLERDYRITNPELRQQIEENYRNKKGLDVVAAENKKWREENKEKVKLYPANRFTVNRDYYIQKTRQERTDLCDNYIRCLLSRIRIAGFKDKVKIIAHHSDIPNEMVEVKREQLKLKRNLKEMGK